MIQQFITDAKRGNIDLVEHASKALESAHAINKEYRYIAAWADPVARAEQLQQLAKTGNARGKLFGVIISVKDNLCVQGVESTASSAILKGYKPLYNATAVQRCLDEGAIILGKTVQDEFGFGGFSINTGAGIEKPLNPIDKKRTCGGSSGGAAGLTKKAPFPHLALAESTGGSIANPASFCGVVGLTPTFGRVSRYGLIDYANSLDKIGSMALTVEDAALLLDAISGPDPRDSTSANAPTDPLTDIPSAIHGLRIGIPQDSFPETMDNTTRRVLMLALQQLEQNGARRLDIKLPISTKYGIAAYYTLAMSEASTNLAKYCGIRYGASEALSGNYNEYFSRVRDNHLGEEAKRRVLLGTFARMAGYRDAFYTKAAQARTKIIQEYQAVFKDVDVIVTPTMPLVAPTFDELKNLTPLQHYQMDILTVPPNLAGLPHITIPVGEAHGMPVGLMITAPHFHEHKMIQVAKSYDKK